MAKSDSPTHIQLTWYGELEAVIREGQYNELAEALGHLKDLHPEDVAQLSQIETKLEAWNNDHTTLLNERRPVLSAQALDAADAKAAAEAGDKHNKFYGTAILEKFRQDYPWDWRPALDTYIDELKKHHWTNPNDINELFSRGGGLNRIGSIVKGRNDEEYEHYLNIRLTSAARVIVGCDFATSTFTVVGFFPSAEKDNRYTEWSKQHGKK